VNIADLRAGEGGQKRTICVSRPRIQYGNQALRIGREDVDG
jgi:hypothetical protein